MDEFSWATPVIEMANLTNRDVAALLTEFARHSNKPGFANPFAARAYLRAAKSLVDSPTSVAELIAGNRVSQLPGVGTKMARTITVLFLTGTHPSLGNMRAKQERLSQ